MSRPGTAALIALAILSAVTCAEAQTVRNWQAASSSWFTSANWDPAGVPTPGDIVRIGNGGTAAVGSFANPATANKVYAGSLGTGTLSITSNTLYTPDAYIGGGPGTLQGVGTANVNWLGTWVCHSVVVVGWYAGEGTLNLNNGGKLETGQIMRVLTATGFDPPPEGTVVYGKGRVLFAGGTLRLNADQDKLFQYFFGGDVLLNHSTLGGTIDTQGFAVRCYVGLQGVGPLTKLGSGTLALAGENTYAGGTYVRGGTLKVMGSSLTHSSKDMRLGTQSGDDATLEINEGTVRNSFGYLGYVAGATGRATVQGADSLWNNDNFLYVGHAGNGTLRVDSGEVRNYSAYVGYNAGSSGAVDINGGLWNCYIVTLANNATSSGTIRLNAGGTLAATQVSRGSGSATFEIDGGILKLKQSQSALFSGFSAGQVTLGSGGVTLDTQQYTVTTAYALGGSGGLVKQGSGTLVLSAAQGYAGETQIGQGALRVDGAVGRVLGLAATTLAGSGTVGAVTLRDGATLAPGAGSASGRLTCASVAGETGRFTLLHRLAAADVSRLTVTGSADFSHGTLALQFTAAPAAGSSFVLIEKSGAGAMIPFPDIPEGHETVQGGLRLRHTYLAGDGNDFAVTVLNTAPAVAPIADRFMARDGHPPAPVDVAVSDAETAADQLALAAFSDNQTLLPDSAMILGGSGENRTLTLAPALGQTGSVSIVVRVSDGGLTAETAFRLTVSPYTELELWRQEHFGTTQGAGPAADDADGDDDKAANLMEFAFALDPHARDAHLLPQPRREAGAWVYRFTPPPHLASVTYGAQACDSLTTPLWLPVPDSGTPPERVFRLPYGPAPAGFLRLSVRVGESEPN